MGDQFNTHPQPRTFAPSKEDVLQNLQYFFGAPVSPEKLKDYSEHRAHSRHSTHHANDPPMCCNP
jgi:truncated hemoglobin YjbI